MLKPPWRVQFWMHIASAAMLLTGTAAHADNLAEDKAMAGFIFNFTKYTEWPPAALSGAELLVCSPSAQPLSGKLAALQGQLVQGRTIQIQSPARQGEWRDCHVLFVAADDAQRIDAVLKNTAQRAVLTISDAPDFVQSGGMIGLKLRGGRIRFEINQGAARQAGLKLSSQLLKLADEVLP